MKLLIIDNDVSTVTTLKALLLSQEAFQIDAAYSGQEGLEKMIANPYYDLVLIDIMMPKMSGIEVCQEMASDQRLKGMSVLLMSSALPLPAQEFHKSLEASNKLGVIKGVLEKPFAIDDLIAKIHQTARKYSSPID